MEDYWEQAVVRFTLRQSEIDDQMLCFAVGFGKD
jgi:hypothetical protein